MEIISQLSIVPTIKNHLDLFIICNDRFYELLHHLI